MLVWSKAIAKAYLITSDGLLAERRFWAASANMGCEKEKTSLDKPHKPRFLMGVNDILPSLAR